MKKNKELNEGTISEISRPIKLSTILDPIPGIAISWMCDLG